MSSGVREGRLPLMGKRKARQSRARRSCFDNRSVTRAIGFAVVFVIGAGLDELVRIVIQRCVS